MPDTLILIAIVIAVLIAGIVLVRALSGGSGDAAPDALPEKRAPEEKAERRVPASEPAPPAAPSEPAPAPPAPVESGPTDDLTKIKGLGPKAASGLAAMGTTRYDQLAAWTDTDLDRLEAELGLRERAERDRWIEQARLLAAGDIAGFEAKFGKLG